MIVQLQRSIWSLQVWPPRQNKLNSRFNHDRKISYVFFLLRLSKSEEFYCAWLVVVVRNSSDVTCFLLTIGLRTSRLSIHTLLLFLLTIQPRENIIIIKVKNLKWTWAPLSRSSKCLESTWLWNDVHWVIALLLLWHHSRLFVANRGIKINLWPITNF